MSKAAPPPHELVYSIEHHMSIWTKVAIGLMVSYGLSLTIQGVMNLDESQSLRQLSKPFTRALQFFVCAYFIGKAHKFIWWIGLSSCLFFASSTGYIAYVLVTSGSYLDVGMRAVYSYSAAAIMLTVAAVALIVGRRDVFRERDV